MDQSKEHQLVETMGDEIQPTVVDEELLQRQGSSDEFYFLHHPFTKLFNSALHSLLISCSRQEVLSYFATFPPRYQDFLYKVYTLTVTQIRENVAAEFQAICEETQLLEALDYASSREFLGATDVKHSTSAKDAVREVAVKRKQEEVDRMKQKLQQAKEDNQSLATQLEGFSGKAGEAKDLRSVNAAIQKISSINLRLENVIRGESFSSRTLLQ